MAELPQSELNERYFNKAYLSKEDYGPFKKGWKFVVTGIIYEGNSYLMALMYEKYDLGNKAFVSSRFDTIEEIDSFLEHFEGLGIVNELTDAVDKSLRELIRAAQ